MEGPLRWKWCGDSLDEGRARAVNNRGLGCEYQRVGLSV